MGRHDEGFFSAKDNLRLYWESELPDAPRAHVAVVHGYADHLGRYRKTIEALAKDGFAVHSFDYRGHGQADGRRGHCDSFSEYIDDLELFWNRVRASADGKKIFLLGHSHGGLMAVHLLRRRPADLAGMILSAPYLKLAIKPNPIQVLAARAVGTFIPWLPQKLPLTSDQLSRDVELQKATDKDPLYNRQLTVRWFAESTKAQAQAIEMGPEVTCPVLMFCGEKDGIASSAASRAFFETVASTDKQFKEWPGMLHEPLNEIGREEVWREISGWISKHL